MFPSVLLALSIQKTRKGIKRNIQRGYLSYGMAMAEACFPTSRKVRKSLSVATSKRKPIQTNMVQRKPQSISMPQRFNSVEAKVMACHLQLFSINGKIIVVVYHSN